MSKIEGVEEVLKSLKSLEDLEQFRVNMGKACALVERAAKQNAPKDNGELARSISSKVDEQDGQIEGIIFTPLEYAPYVEYGTGLFAEESGRKDVPWNYQDDRGEWHSTSGQHPQPFMRPALNESKQQILKILREGLQPK